MSAQAQALDQSIGNQGESKEIMRKSCPNRNSSAPRISYSSFKIPRIPSRFRLGTPQVVTQGGGIGSACALVWEASFVQNVELAISSALDPPGFRLLNVDAFVSVRRSTLHRCIPADVTVQCLRLQDPRDGSC